jgi:uncharacterized membrane protein YheB (UPF0754 family)
VSLIRWNLFQPAKPVALPGFRLQGLVPAYREALSKALAQKAADEIAQIKGLEEQLTKPENFEKLKPVIEDHMDDFLRNRLKEQMPMISMFIGDKTITSLKGIFISEIEKLFPRVIGQYAGNLQKEIPVYTLVLDRLQSISDQEIRQNLGKALQPVFRALYSFAIVLGLVMAAVLFLIQKSAL